jgi:hypothetical protein
MATSTFDEASNNSEATPFTASTSDDDSDIAPKLNAAIDMSIR